MQQAIFFMGLPGSGKTTARKYFPHISTFISTDDIIEAYAYKFDKNYSEVFHLLIETAETEMMSKFQFALKSKHSFIIDRTNMTVKSRKKFLSQIPSDYTKVIYLFDPHMDIIKQRREERVLSGKDVPITVIEEMKKRSELPTTDEGFHAVFDFVCGVNL